MSGTVPITISRLRLPSFGKLMLLHRLCKLASHPSSSRRFFSSSSYSMSGSSSSSSLTCSHRSFATITNDGHESDPNVEEIYAKKRSLRSQIRKQLKNMSPALRAQEDNAIQNVVLKAPWFRDANHICAYVDCDSLREVDTSKLLSTILCGDDKAEDNCSKMMKKLYLPRIEDKNSNMRMLRVCSYEDLFPNSMNILEPTLQDHSGNEREDLMQASQPVDLFLIPGLAFDQSGRRLGRGGGYYDVYLKKYFEVVKKRKWKAPLIVALLYSIQIVEDGAIGVTSDDVPVDALVCPTGIIYTNVVDKN